MTAAASDPLGIVVECATPDDVWPVLLHINNNLLPMEVKRPFAALILVWMVEQSDEALLQLVRGKTVGELIRQHGSIPMPSPTDSGEKDGLRWRLFAPPGHNNRA